MHTPPWRVGQGDPVTENLTTKQAPPPGAWGGVSRLLTLIDAIGGHAMSEMRYVIVRTFSAGVFAGELESRNGREVVLRGARRLWFWDGAASLSQLAMEGTAKPGRCKFPCEVDRIELLEAIEILDVAPGVRESIAAVPVWKV